MSRIPLVMLDAGHGPKSPGAAGNGIDEQALNWVLIQKIAAFCTWDSWATMLTRQDYFNTPSLTERVNYANAMDADLFVSIHVNAGDPSQRGAEVYHYGPSSKGSELATIMSENIHDEIGGRVRIVGSPSQNYPRTLFVLKKTRPWALLIEACYLSNPTDAAKLKTRTFPDAFCLGVAQGIHSCFHHLGKVV